jgi:spoIIIJ-associated protein
MTKELVRDGKLDREAAAEALREFLQKIVRAGKFELNVKVRTAEVTAGLEGDAEVFADLDGKDREILLARGAELLKALEHMAFRALRLEPAFHEKIHLDCGGYRALRFEELKMTARVAA